MAPLRRKALTDFRAALLTWFQREGRDWPWRRTRDPYAILVSEIMLQQTRISTVLDRGYYTRWMERFPDISTLARAGEADILRLWEGLGYYRRARNLQSAARTIMGRHGGSFPDTLDEIAALPGVGRYTAGAILSFAWNQPASIVDGNVARVLSRLFGLQDEISAPAARRTLWAWADALTDPAQPRCYNSAIMELGQRLCTPRQPACHDCPVRAHCRSAGPQADLLPRKKPARATVFLDEHVVWAANRGRLLLTQESGSRRHGLWRLPVRTAGEVIPLPLLRRSQYSITHHRVTLFVYQAAKIKPRPGESWQAVELLGALPMPGPFRKVVDALILQ